MEQVVPLVGTWIETSIRAGISVICLVVPLVGTWIETRVFHTKYRHNQSFPSWERGLKHGSGKDQRCGSCVVPLVGTWIETSMMTITSILHSCRSPRGNVD